MKIKKYYRKGCYTWEIFGIKFKISKQNNFLKKYKIKTKEYLKRKTDNTSVTLNLVGDVMCETYCQQTCIYDDKYFFRDCFSIVKPALEDADFVVGNLETTISENHPYMGQKNLLNGNYNCNSPVEFLDALKYAGFNVLVEETTISSIRSSLGLNYAGSYDASRVLMEQAKEKFPSLIYFIDLHRDSLSHDKTTLTYNDKSYAKVMFLVGLENPNYQGNLDFSTKISDLINTKIPGLSKGIYEKEGAGVNGVYNQDFSNRTILIEIGGPENTIDEVYETLLVLSEVLSEVINSDQN